MLHGFIKLHKNHILISLALRSIDGYVVFSNTALIADICQNFPPEDNEERLFSQVYNNDVERQ